MDLMKFYWAKKVGKNYWQMLSHGCISKACGPKEARCKRMHIISLNKILKDAKLISGERSHQLFLPKGHELTRRTREEFSVALGIFLSWLGSRFGPDCTNTWLLVNCIPELWVSYSVNIIQQFRGRTGGEGKGCRKNYDGSCTCTSSLWWI